MKMKEETEKFKALVHLEGTIEMSTEATGFDEAMKKIINSPLFKLIKEADDVDVDIDVQDLWKVTEEE